MMQGQGDQAQALVYSDSDLISPKSRDALQVVFILDITGSMGSQIQGVKSMVSQFCSVPRPGIVIHIWTYTEDGKGCYVSKSAPNLTASDLVTYVNKLTLCHPPDYPLVGNAGGGDGPENVVAGVTALLDSFGPDKNILCFIITDNAPHHKPFGESAEARQEISWLQAHGHTNPDVFVLLNEVIESLNVTFVPILYSNAERYRWFQQAAILTEGVILCPKSTDSTLLANGLGSLMHSFQQLSVSGRVDSGQNMDQLCTGFSLVSTVSVDYVPVIQDFDSVRDCSFAAVKKNSPQEIEVAIIGLMQTTCDRFQGKKSDKRCRAVNPALIASSVRVLIMSMLYLVESRLFNESTLNKAVAKLLESLKDANTDTSEFESKCLNHWIDNLQNSKTALDTEVVAADLQPVQCVITLEGAMDYLNGLEQLPRTESDVSAWMEIVLQLTMCRLINISFPVNQLSGLTDFADAWSASIRHIETASVLTTFSATKLRDPDTCMYLDPMSRRNNSAAVILAHPNDLVLTMIYYGLSALPSLQGLVQSYLVSGGLKIFPAIVPGIQSSCLLYLLRTSSVSGSFTQADWEVARCLVWSLRQNVQTPASQIVKSLKNGRGLNPVDSISKLLAGVINYLKQSKLEMTNPAVQIILQSLFEEMSADLVNFILSKREKLEQDQPPKDDGLPTELEIASCFVRIDNLDEFQPCSGLHEIEKLKDLDLSKFEDSMKKLSEIILPCGALKKFLDVIQRFYNLLSFDLKTIEVPSKQHPIPLSKDEMSAIFIESLILRKRTGRYILDADKHWNLPASAADAPNIQNICISNLIEIFKPKMKEWSLARQQFARSELLNLVSKISGSTFDTCNEQLANLKYDLVGNKYTLGRMDVPDALKNITEKQLKTVGMAICIGSWTPEPPSQLRRFCSSICQHFSSNLELVGRKNITMNE